MALPRSAVHRPARLLVGLVVALLGIVLASPTLAHAEDTTSLVVDAQLRPDGRLVVSATLTLADGAPDQITQSLITRRPIGDHRERVYTIEKLQASALGRELPATLTSDDDRQTITVNADAASGRPIVISYEVVGAVTALPTTPGRAPAHEFSWPVLQGLSIPVHEISGRVRTAAPASRYDCHAGPAVSPGDCTMWSAGTSESRLPTFADGPRAAGEVVELTFTVPADMVAANARVHEGWSLDRAFTVNRASAGLAMATLLAGLLGLWLLHRRHGRDEAASAHPTLVAEFAPVGEGLVEFELLEEIRPGQVGTVVDERVDPVDVTATILDLAVRGWLRIEQLPTSPHEALDWTFHRLEHGRGELRPYEHLLRDAVAPEDGTVRASTIVEAVGPVVPAVQQALYEEVVAHGWFTRRPDAARQRFEVAGWTALITAFVVSGLLIAFTRLGLVGLAMVVLAIGLIMTAQEMPRRSRRGSALQAGLQVLAMQLQHQRTDQMPPGAELREFSEVLPYAVVLGGKDRWLHAIVAADDDADPDPHDLDWYHAPADWHLRHLPASVDAFITTLQGRLFGR